jgi:hypothetical protein
MVTQQRANGIAATPAKSLKQGSLYEPLFAPHREYSYAKHSLANGTRNDYQPLLPKNCRMKQQEVAPFCWTRERQT